MQKIKKFQKLLIETCCVEFEQKLWSEKKAETLIYRKISFMNIVPAQPWRTMFQVWKNRIKTFWEIEVVLNFSPKLFFSNSTSKYVSNPEKTSTDKLKRRVLEIQRLVEENLLLFVHKLGADTWNSDQLFTQKQT